MIRVLAVDDEPRALDDLVRMLTATEGVAEVVASGVSSEALALLSAGGFDAAFLDVRMPGLDGVELARILRAFAHPPAIVFVSAHESAAVEAFALRALDYLLKPVSRRRVQETVARVIASRQAARAIQGEAAATQEVVDHEVVPVQNLRGGGTRLIKRSDVLFVEAHGDYVRLHTDAGRYLLRAKISELEERWEPHGFIRVHRGYLAQLRRAREVRPLLNGTAVLVFNDELEIPVARRQSGELMRSLGL